MLNVEAAPYAETINQCQTLMRAFNMVSNPIKEIALTKKKINYSEGGILYWLDNNPEWAKRVHEFEINEKKFVYHCVHARTADDELLICLFVDPFDKKGWRKEVVDVYDHNVFTYTINLTCDWCSEYGYAPLKPLFGGVGIETN